MNVKEEAKYFKNELIKLKETKIAQIKRFNEYELGYSMPNDMILALKDLENDIEAINRVTNMIKER